jgi:hypothetical protein
MNWPFSRKPKLEPDVEAFLDALHKSVAGKQLDGKDIAVAMRHLFTRHDPQLGRVVLHALLTWCGEYENPPEDNEALQRWAGKREIAVRIKAAMHADL